MSNQETRNNWKLIAIFSAVVTLTMVAFLLKAATPFGKALDWGIVLAPFMIALFVTIGFFMYIVICNILATIYYSYRRYKFSKSEKIKLKK